jgi:hypothetical protein
VVDESGLSVFDLLRYRHHDQDALLCAWDLIELDGKDLRHTVIEERKGTLAKLLSHFHEASPSTSTTPAGRHHLQARLRARLRRYRIEAARLHILLRPSRSVDDQGALSRLVTAPRRFPPPWSIDDPDSKLGQDCFIVRDDRQARRAAAHLLTPSQRTSPSCRSCFANRLWRIRHNDDFCMSSPPSDEACAGPRASVATLRLFLRGAKMKESDSATGKGAVETGEGIDHDRREAVMRLAKYTAPAMLAVLMSSQAAPAVTLIVLPESDIRLKRDIAQLGELDSGINLYRYRYLWSDTTFVGVMAQEVAAVMPQAVQRGADGYLRVDYARLGLRLQTWDQWAAAH